MRDLPVPAASPELIRVAVVSPSPAVRSGLRALVDGHEGIEVVAEWLDPGDAEQQADSVVLLLAEADTASFVEWRELAVTWPLVLVGALESLHALRDLLRRPAALISREATGPELTAAIVAVSRGLAVADPTLVTAAPSDSIGLADDVGDGSPLTPRELDVLRLVAVGLPNKGIALELGISEHTVKFHIASIMGKLDASSRTEAVTLAVRRGVLPL